MKLNTNIFKRILKLPIIVGTCGILAGVAFIFLRITNVLVGRTPFLIGALFVFSSASSLAFWLWLFERGDKPKK